MTATVDVHAHALLPAIEQAVAGLARSAQTDLDRARELDRVRNGAAALLVSGQMVRERSAQLTDVTRRLADMDAAGVDVQVVSPSPSQYHYWADAGPAETVWRTAASEMAALCAQAPTRLVGLALAPLQHPEHMTAALDCAVLEHGLRGVEISSHAPGPTRAVELSDPRLDPFWSRAEELGAIVFVHPFGCTLDERLDAWYLSNIVGQPVENAVALSHLIMSGTLDRHPDLRVIVSHGGGYLPAFTGRMDHGWRDRDDVRGCAHLPSSYLRRLHFDSLVHTPEALRILIAAVGASQVLLGSDYPFDMGVPDPVQRLHAAGLAGPELDGLLGTNAARLGLVPASDPPLTRSVIQENA